MTSSGHFSVNLAQFFVLNCANFMKVHLCAILTGLANLSAKYFFILLHRNQDLFKFCPCVSCAKRLYCFRFGSANWLYQKRGETHTNTKQTKRERRFLFRIFHLLHIPLSDVLALSLLMRRLRKGCRMQFNLLVGSYLLSNFCLR